MLFLDGKLSICIDKSYCFKVLRIIFKCIKTDLNFILLRFFQMTPTF